MSTLQNILLRLKETRGFKTETFIINKAHKINAYFRQSGLDSAVLGVSGGVDSAVVLGLLRFASQQTDSPIKKILSLLMPIESRGATDQNIALERGRKVIEALGGDYWVCPLNKVQEAYVSAMPQLESTAWSEGQLLSVVRTPALYYAAAQLQAHGLRSLVAGTTNRDEGAYLGFFGKASDGMVDLQPISDLHKSEVYALAEYFGVPEEVINAPPSGNVFDGKLDEEMIGAPYWFIELYLMAKSQEFELDVQALSKRDQEKYQIWSRAIETQHQKNAHKYLVGSPAVHLDVLPRFISGGWE